MFRLNHTHLRSFHAVAHEGHLTRAAERLNVAQSALSTQIRALETELGHELFERRGRALVLTEAGRIALDHADRIFATGDELVATLGQRGAAARQILRVGAVATLSRNFQIGFLRPVLGRADVEVVVRSGGLGDLLRSLEALRLDVVLATTAPARDAATPWIARRIADQPVSLVGRAGRVTDGADLGAILDTEPLALPTAESSIRTGFDALADRLGITPRIAAEIDDMAMLRLVAREGHALAVVPPIVVRDELAAGHLVEIARLPDLSETFFAITLARRFPNPLLADVLETLREPAIAESRES